MSRWSELLEYKNFFLSFKFISHSHDTLDVERIFFHTKRRIFITSHTIDCKVTTGTKGCGVCELLIYENNTRMHDGWKHVWKLELFMFNHAIFMLENLSRIKCWGNVTWFQLVMQEMCWFSMDFNDWMFFCFSNVKGFTGVQNEVWKTFENITFQ